MLKPVKRVIKRINRFFEPIDLWIEKKYKKDLHLKREKIIKKMMKKYLKKHPDLSPEMISLLREKLDEEANRVYIIADLSILRPRILRARWLVLLSLPVVIVVTGVLGAFSHGAILPFVGPITGMILSWVVLVVTIPLNYNGRVEAGFETILDAFGKNKNVIEIEVSPLSSHGVILDELIKNNPGKKIILHVRPLANSELINLDEKVELADEMHVIDFDESDSLSSCQLEARFSSRFCC